jgi:hypothetical protein
MSTPIRPFLWSPPPDVPWTWPLEWIGGVRRPWMSEPERLARHGQVDLADRFYFSSKHSAVPIDLPVWVPRELEGSDPDPACTDRLPRAVARFRSRALVRR